MSREHYYIIYPTELELRRAALLAQGMSTKEIADAETVSADTIKSTFKRLINKMGVDNRLQLVIELQRRKLLVWDRNREHLGVNGYLFREE